MLAHSECAKIMLASIAVLCRSICGICFMKGMWKYEAVALLFLYNQ